MHRNNFSRASVPRPFGAANWVTLVRALFAAALLGWGLIELGSSDPVATGLRWLMVAGAVAALCLDGVDGYLARRFNQTSAFGARFDLETDALTMLALSILVWGLGQAGAWVLASGFMRYIFVFAGWLWPVLAMPLPPRKRRQTLCVVQLIALILALAPVVTPPWAAAICLAGLILLSYSFGVDLAGLVGRARMEGRAVC